MLMPEQVGKYFADLRDPGMATALALVHSRFSTNTFPSWDRSHPYRYIAHNGEINTLRGNINWMHAGQSNFVSELFGSDIKKVLPVINTDGSDSAMFDNCGGIARHVGPRIAARDDDDDSRAVGKSREHVAGETRVLRISFLPDGAVGRPGVHRVHRRLKIGACLDRNGLRPSRYYVTKDDMVIMASEAGVLPVEPERRGKLRVLFGCGGDRVAQAPTDGSSCTAAGGCRVRHQR